jgi:hypothetical protein
MTRKWLVLLAALSFAGMCLGQNVNSSAEREDLSSPKETHEPPMLGIHWSRGSNPSARDRSSKTSPDMTYHGGVINAIYRKRSDFLGTELGDPALPGTRLPVSTVGTADSTAPITPRLPTSTTVRMGRLGPL